MTIENIWLSISMKVWEGGRIEFTASGSAIGLATDWAMGPGDTKVHEVDIELSMI